MLNTDEVRRLIDAAPNLRYRTSLMTLYDDGMRRAELCQLRPQDMLTMAHLGGYGVFQPKPLLLTSGDTPI